MQPPRKKVYRPRSTVEESPKISAFDVYDVPCDIIVEVLALFSRKRTPKLKFFEIFSLSSPFDLLQFQQTCKLFNEILAENSVCWKRAFCNLGLPPPIPFRGLGKLSLPAYSRAIFIGGACSVGFLDLAPHIYLLTCVALRKMDGGIPCFFYFTHTSVLCE